MAVGDIGAVIDTLVCNAIASEFPTVAHVHADIYVIACQANDTTGWLYTVQIDSTGQIPATVEDSHQFQGTLCKKPRIIKVAANVFAIAYSGPAGDGYVATWEIADDGTINTTRLDILEFDTDSCANPEICKIADNVYLIAYTFSTNDLKIVTVVISNAGVIPGAVEDSWQCVPGEYYFIDVIKLPNGVYAFFRQDTGNDGHVDTVAISAGGTISDSIIDNLEFDTSNACGNFVINVSANVYATVYARTGNQGYICTMEILPNGQVGAAYIDKYQYDSGYATHPSVVPVAPTVFAIAARSATDEGKIYTIKIHNNGNIASALIDTLIFDSANGGTPWIFHIDAGVFAVAYQGASNYLTLKTFDIKTPVTAQHILLMGIG